MPSSGVLVAHVSLATSHCCRVGFCVAFCVVSALNSHPAIQSEVYISAAMYELSPSKLVLYMIVFLCLDLLYMMVQARMH